MKESVEVDRDLTFITQKDGKSTRVLAWSIEPKIQTAQIDRVLKRVKEIAGINCKECEQHERDKQNMINEGSPV